MMNRKEIIEKAKKYKENGGVGSKFVGLPNCKDEPINKCLHETKRLLSILEKY